MLLDEVALVLRGQVGSPEDGELELAPVGHSLLEDFDALGVGEADEVVCGDELEPLDEVGVDHLVEELEVVLAVVEGPLDAELDELLGEVHVVVDVVEGHFGLNHPELGEVAWCIGVLGAECRAEGVDGSEGCGGQLSLELSGDGEAGLAAEEVLRVVDFAVGGAWEVVEVECRDLEHLPCAFAVGAGDEWRVEVDEAFVVEELVDGEGHVVPDAEDGAEGIGPRAEVRDLAEVLPGVAFLLEGECGVGVAEDLDFGGLDLDGLAFALRGYERSRCGDARACGYPAERLFVDLGGGHDNLEVGHHGAVV